MKSYGDASGLIRMVEMVGSRATAMPRRVTTGNRR